MKRNGVGRGLRSRAVRGGEVVGAIELSWEPFPDAGRRERRRGSSQRLKALERKKDGDAVRGGDPSRPGSGLKAAQVKREATIQRSFTNRGCQTRSAREEVGGREGNKHWAPWRDHVPIPQCQMSGSVERSNLPAKGAIDTPTSCHARENRGQKVRDKEGCDEVPMWGREKRGEKSIFNKDRY